MPRERIANYDVLSECGRGAVARVLKAVDTRSGAIHALKQALDASETCRWYLVQEFETLSQLSHPNIVKVFDCGTSQDGRFFFAMEYVEGVPVDQAFRGASHELEEALRQLLDALGYIHAEGLVHGDIKPANLLISRDGGGSDGTLRAVLTDFGFAHHPALDRDGESGGTIGYAPPELLRGERLDGRADLYSLGLVLYEILCGRRAFRADRPIDLLREQLSHDLEPPSSLDPRIPPRLDLLVHRLTAREAHDRVSCAEEARALLRSDGEAARSGSPPPPILRPTLSFVGRERERAQIREIYSLACGGEGQVVLVLGGRGVGKSRFIREVVNAFRLSGTHTVNASFTGSQPDSLRALQEMWARPPDHREQSPGDDAQMIRIFDRLLEDLTAGAEARPASSRATVIAIDDAHLAGASSEGLLRYMVHSARRRHLLLVLASETEAAVEKIVGLDDHDVALTIIRLAPLDRLESISLVSQALGSRPGADEIADAIYDATGGHPLLIRDRLTAAEGDLSRTGARPDDSRSSPDDAVRACIAALLPFERRVLAVAALAGRRTTPGLLCAALDEPPGQLLRALRALEQKNLIRHALSEPSSPHRYELDDRTTRELALELPAPDERRDFHLRIAEYLSKTPASPQSHIEAEIAAHFLQAGKEAEARPYARLAGCAALRYGDRHAAAWYLSASLPRDPKQPLTDEDRETERTLIELYEKLGQPMRAAEWLTRLMAEDGEEAARRSPRAEGDLALRLATFLRAAGMYEEALSTLDDLVPEEEIGLGARALAERAHIYGLTGQTERAAAAANEALALLDEIDDPADRHEVLYAGAIARWRAGDAAGALGLCETGLASASRSPEQDARLLGVRSILLAELRAHDDARESYRACFEIQKRIGDLHGMMVTDFNLGRLAQDCGDRHEATACFARALVASEQLGDRPMTARISHAYGIIRKQQGEWNEAAQLLERSAREYRRLGQRSDEAFGLDSLALIRAGQGEVEEAFGLLERALSLREEAGGPTAIPYSHQKFGQLCLELGRLEEAKEYLTKALRGFEAQGASKKVAGTATLLAEADVLLGRPIAARRQINRALRITDDTHPLEDRGDMERVLALVAASQGRNADAREHFERSIDMLRRAGARPLLAKTLMHAAGWILEGRTDSSATGPENGSGERERPARARAREYLKEALSIYASMGATLYQPVLDSLSDAAFDVVGADGTAGGDEMRYLKAFSELGGIIQQIDDRHALLTELLDRLVAVLAAERGALFVCSHGSDAPFLAVGRNMDSVALEDASKLSRQAVATAATTSRLIVVGDAQRDPSWSDYPSIRRNRIRSLICVPLIVNRSVKGTLYLDSSLAPDLFSEDAQVFVTGLASLVGGVLDASDLYEEAMRENAHLRGELGRQFAFRHIVGESPELMEALQLAERIASTDVVILIQGETGTGKDLLAQAIHSCSDRREGPFLRVDCGALPETLLQSELFGHARGAFTGAFRQRTGLVRQADGGTLFLDEVGNAPESVQRGLLAVLERGEVRSIGDDVWKEVDVRIICATNQDLAAEVAGNRFRQDLFYRISGVTIDLPPLRARGGDVLLLAEHFLALSARQLERKVRRLSPSVETCLCRHSWPGNVRELQNCVQRAVAVCPGETVRLEDLDPRIVGSVWDGSELGEARRLVESDRASRALALSRGNVTRAAAILNISRRQMQRIMKKHGLTRTDYSARPLERGGAGDTLM